MYLFLVRYYFYQWNHEKLKSLNSHMKVVSQGHCGFLPSPAAKIKGTYQKLFPHGLPGSNKEASIEEENYTLLDLARIECCHIILSNLG